MTSKFLNALGRRFHAPVLALALLQACSNSYSYQENAVPEPVKLSPRLQALFAKTKLVCFGRYAVEVPVEAEILRAGFDVEVINGGIEAMKSRVAADIAKLKWKDKSAQFTYNKEGPVDGSWQIRYYESDNAKRYGLHFFDTYVNKGDLSFIFGDAIDKAETEESTAARQSVVAKNLRLRANDEVPDEPGFCFEHGFLADNLYARQETASAGIFLPSLPDVTFSISSSKDAYGDFSPAEFEKTERAALSLLNRIEGAKKLQGIHYPSRTVLREGKRDVQHWHGEESLIKRPGDVHDFEWALVGTPRDVANPSEFGVQMYSKVENNKVGAASASSVTDDEAVALWDKLLSGLKFRVKVPGAPQGSYFIPASKPGSEPVANAHLTGQPERKD
jgi:hypothetical protein